MLSTGLTLRESSNPCLCKRKWFELSCAKVRHGERGEEKQTECSLSIYGVLNGLELSLWPLRGVVLIRGGLALQHLYKHLTGIMSQYNSVHQHRDSTTTHTCFLTRGCKDEPLACFQLFHRRSSLKGNLQIWQSRPANGWKTLSHAWCQNLRHKLLSAIGAALRVMHVSNTVLGKKIWVLCMWLQQPTACLFWVTLKSVIVSWHHPNQWTGKHDYCLGLLRSQKLGDKIKATDLTFSFKPLIVKTTTAVSRN